jgi:PmbA protein
MTDRPAHDIQAEASSKAAGASDQQAEFNQLEMRVAEALEHARKHGADSVEASASLQGGLSATVRLGEVETIEHNRDRGISVTVYRDGRKGHASSADLAPATVLACVERAVEIARFTEQDRCNGLADQQRLATRFPDLDLWHPHPMDANQAIARAMEIEAAGRANPQVSNSEGTSVSASFGQSVYGNSHGFVGRSSGTRYGQVCVLIAGSGERMQRDYWYDSQRSFADLEAPALTGEQAAQRTVQRLGARKINTVQAPVLFAPEVARSLFGHLLGAVSGGALYRNASFLKDAAGQQLFPGWLSLLERPYLKRGAGSSAFDGEGVATVERELVDAGVLTGYVLSSYSARRLGLETTGNAGGIHNLLLDGPLVPRQELLSDMGSGLLVTEVMGQGVSTVTGDYSRGAAGFWVENGEIAYPVEEVTIAGNLRSMFAGIRAAGDDVDRRNNVQTGSLLVDGMTIAGS